MAYIPVDPEIKRRNYSLAALRRAQEIDPVTGLRKSIIAARKAGKTKILRGTGKLGAAKANITMNEAVDGKTRRQLLMDKRRATMSVKDENGLTGFQKNMLAVASSRRLPDGSYKGIAKTVETKRNTIDENGNDLFVRAAINTAITRFGVYAGLEGKSDFQKYQYQVDKVTNRQPLHLLENFEKRGGYGYSNDPYQIDHQYSVVYGFLNSVPPYIVGHIYAI